MDNKPERVLLSRDVYAILNGDAVFPISGDDKASMPYLSGPVLAGMAQESSNLVRRCTDVGDPGRKAGLIGCLRLKHVAVRGHRHERGDEVVRGGANERALPRLGLRHRSQGASRCRPRHGERREEDRDAGGEAPQPEAA